MVFGLFGSSKAQYINHLTSISGFNDLRDDSGIFLLFAYKPKCDKCLPKFVEIYQRLERSRATNMYQLDVISFPELKDHISKKIGKKVKYPQVLMLKDQEIIATRSGSEVSDSNIQSAIEELVLA